jgi:hypothetical protein
VSLTVIAEMERERVTDRPDLRSLDRAEGTHIVSGVFFWGCLPFAAIGVWLLSPARSILILPTGIAAIALFSLLYRASHAKLMTDERGITYRRLAFRRFIPWTSVIRAETPRNEDDGTFSILVESAKQRISVFMESPEDCYLKASICQHLRRHGKQCSLELSKAALTLWTEIPESIPQEFDWNYAMGRDGGPPPCMYELRKTHISQTVTGRKRRGDIGAKRPDPVRINWSEVTGAKWQSFVDTDLTSLIVRGIGRRHIEIPLSRKAKDSAIVTLGVIRRLREIDCVGPLAFPPRLLRQSGTSEEADEHL